MSDLTLEEMRKAIPRRRQKLVAAARLSKKQRQLKEACEMRVDGKSNTEIAAHFGVTPETVSGWWRKEFAVRYLYELTRDQLSALETRVNAKVISYVPDALDALHELLGARSEKVRHDAAATLIKVGLDILAEWKRAGSPQEAEQQMALMEQLLKEKRVSATQVNVIIETGGRDVGLVEGQAGLLPP